MFESEISTLVYLTIKSSDDLKMLLMNIFETNNFLFRMYF